MAIHSTMYVEVLNRRKARPSFSFRHQGVNLYFCLLRGLLLTCSYCFVSQLPQRRLQACENRKARSEHKERLSANSCFQMSLLGRHNLTPPLPHSLARKSLPQNPRLSYQCPSFCRERTWFLQSTKEISAFTFSPSSIGSTMRKSPAGDKDKGVPV